MSIFRYSIPALNTALFSPVARLSDLRHEVDRLFDLASSNRSSDHNDRWSPALDLYQDKDNLLIKVEVPGVRKEDISLLFHDDRLTLTGERHLEETRDGKGTLRNERFFGRFERTLTLPIQVDGTRVSASYENGILTVTLPKAEAAKPRQIEIGVK